MPEDATRDRPDEGVPEHKDDARYRPSRARFTQVRTETSLCIVLPRLTVELPLPLELAESS